MILDDELRAEAQRRADAAIDYRTEDDRWAVLAELIEQDAAAQREHAIEFLKREMIRDALYPGISSEQWRKLGWNNALRGRDGAEKFIHKLRLAKAAGSADGRL